MSYIPIAHYLFKLADRQSEDPLPNLSQESGSIEFPINIVKKGQPGYQDMLKMLDQPRVPQLIEQ